MDKPQKYFMGDLAEYTGKSEVMYGQLFYELLILEGHIKGKLRYTPDHPDKYMDTITEVMFEVGKIIYNQ